MTAKNNNILNVLDENEDQVVYVINSEANFGVNPSQAITSAISRAINVEKISQFRESTVSGIFQSVLSKYITHAVAKKPTQLESFRLQVDKYTDEFYMSFSDGKHPGYTDEIRKGGYEICGAMEENALIVQAKEIELLDARNCYGKQILPAFLSGDFRGELLSTTTIVSKYSGEVKMGATQATRTDQGIEVSTACFNVGEDMTGTLEASSRELVLLENKDQNENVVVTEGEVSAFYNAFQSGREMIEKQLFGFSTNLDETPTE